MAVLDRFVNLHKFLLISSSLSLSRTIRNFLRKKSGGGGNFETLELG